jgi:hypothetical protein
MRMIDSKADSNPSRYERQKPGLLGTASRSNRTAADALSEELPGFTDQTIMPAYGQTRE